jgi:uncharacterized protein YprB with RNaseH-like and TPR domain
MLAPVHRLKKVDIVWMSQHRCKHRHTYLEHYNCYLEEVTPKERMGFFDIETSNLAANFGIMYCYCIKEHGTDKIYSSIIDEKRIHKDLDKQVVKQCIKDIQKFDKLITFYGTRFDIPFLRTRALYWGLDFPEFGQLYHNDLYYTIKYKCRLHSNRLENACRTILGRTDKTHLDPIAWIRALQGDKKSLSYIHQHCVYDVQDLEKLWERVHNFTAPKNTSV